MYDIWGEKTLSRIYLSVGEFKINKYILDMFC